MGVTRWRRLAERGCPLGLLAAGVYVLVRVLLSQRRCRLAALGVVASTAALFWFQDPANQSSPSVQSRNQASADLLALDLIDLGTAGEGVVATGVNAGGDVCGTVILNEREVHAVAWRGRKMIDLGTLGGEASLSSSLNDSGVVVGISVTGRQTLRGFRWRNGRMDELGSMDGRLSCATGINNRGDVSGYSSENGDRLVACNWRGGRPEPLGLPRGYAYSAAEDIDDSGRSVGVAITDDLERLRAVSWSRGRAQDLGTLGGVSSVATCASAGDLSGGASMVRGGAEKDWHACLWKAGKPADLGRLPEMEWAVVVAVNGSGDSVGASGVG